MVQYLCRQGQNLGAAEGRRTCSSRHAVIPPGIPRRGTFLLQQLTLHPVDTRVLQSLDALGVMSPHRMAYPAYLMPFPAAGHTGSATN